MHHFKKTILAASIVALVPTVSHAQLEEVLVTATKRVESLQDVSMSVSAVSGESIARLGSADFNDIATSVPSLSLKSSGPGRTKLNIRGVSAATGVAPTVSFYIDEMSISTISSGSSTSFAQTIVDPKLYDLARVEVLRGPQGTLYGSSSMGGTVRLITSQPLVGESEGSVNAELSSTEEGDLNYLVNGMYNLPTGDNSALRMVGSYTDRDGYMDRVSRDTGKTFDEGVNTEETLALRAAWRYEFDGGDGYIQPFIFYQENEMDGKPNYDGPHDEYEQIRLYDAAEPFDDEFTMVNLTYGQDFNSVSLMASLSKLDREFSNVEDITDQAIGAFGPHAEAVYADEEVELDDLTFESRLSSNTDHALQWMGGIYYKDSEADSGYRMQRGFNQELSIYGLANTQDKKSYEEYAAFGEMTYDFGEKFSVTVGARYLDYTFEQYKEDWGFVYDSAGGGTDRDAANILDLTVEDDDVHGKLTGTYHINDASQLYATVSNGSRPGGGNRAVPRSTNPAEVTAYACDQDLNALGISGSPDSYAGDEVVNTEFGWKSMISDSVRFNGAIYLIEWDDIQQLVTTSGTCGFNFTTNIGKAESQGVELELMTAITDNFSANFALGYTDAEFKDDVSSAGIESGDLLADVPEWTFNLTLDYVIPVSTGEFFAVFNYNYVDETLEIAGQADSDVSGNDIVSGNVKPDYEILDLRVGFTSENNWEAVLFVDNLTDEEAIYSYSDVLAFQPSDYDRTVRNRPRTYGVSVSYNF
jgi:outer membrane receptor protein involved in Fe transport